MMLTAKQYEVVGRLAVASSDLEFLVHYYTVHLDNFYLKGVAVELSSAELSPKRNTFEQKRKQLTNVLDKIAVRHTSLKTNVETVQCRLNEIADFAELRNAVVHGIIRLDSSTGRPVIEHHSACHRFDQDKFGDDARHAVALYDSLANECGELFDGLLDASAQQGT